MKLIMTVLARDEADIIRENIEFHLASGVDHVIATDNGSTDGTIEILEEYEKAGVLTLLHEPSRTFRQADWVTRMAMMARDRFGADWILNNDSDEFWLAPGRDLKAAIGATDADVLRCRRFNMIAPWPEIGRKPWHETLRWRVRRPKPLTPPEDIYRDPIALPFFYYALPPKVLTRTEGLLEIGPGNHRAIYRSEAVVRESPIKIYHYPCRDIGRFSANFRGIGEASERDPNRDPRQSWKARRWYRMMEADGNADRPLAEAMPGVRAFRRHRLLRTVVRDDAMYDILSAQIAGR